MTDIYATTVSKELSKYDPHDRLVTKIAALGIETMVVVWIRQFMLVRTHRGRIRGQLSEEE
jgi:hypothetical protein